MEEERGGFFVKLEGFLRWTVALRIPLLGFAGLILLPLLGRGSAMLGNLFVLESAGELFLVASVAFATASLSWLSASLILEYGPERMRLPSLVRGDLLQQRFSVSLLGPYLAALPLVGVVLSESGMGLSLDNLGAIAAGLVMLSAFLWFANRVRLWLRHFFSAWPVRPPLPLGAGYVNYDSGRVHGGHVSAVAIFLSLSAVYVLGYFFFHPVHRPFVVVPPLVYVLAYVMLLVSLFAGAAFFLDRFRVPVLVAFVAVSWGISSWKGSDHYYAVYMEESGTQHGTAPVEAPVAAILPAGEGEPRAPVILVCASGGGIWAAAWTAEVLTGLQAELGDGFVRSIRLVSSVSGGSIGAMHFLERYGESGAPDTAQGECIRQLAQRSGLASTVWGIVYPDFLRAWLPVRLLDPIYDRGWVLERGWMRELEGCELAGGVESRWSDWVARTRSGELPGVVFNATVVETGQRLLFSTVGIPGARQAISFLDQPGYHRDIDVVTAARLSATFPYVTPVARPRTVNGDVDVDLAEHVADGGYYDNFGVFSAVEWLWALSRTEDFERLGPIFFLEIRAFPEARPHVPDCATRERGGWYYEAAGPLEAVLATRNTTQTARNDGEIELLRAALGPDRIGPSVIVRPKHRETQGCWCEEGDYPLSWHLSPAQRADVRTEWDRVRPEVVSELRARLE